MAEERLTPKNFWRIAAVALRSTQWHWTGSNSRSFWYGVPVSRIVLITSISQLFTKLARIRTMFVCMNGIGAEF